MAISHAKSNTIADFAATITGFNSAGATTQISATDLVRPSDWNSAHNYYVRISSAGAGTTSGTSSGSGTDLVYGASNDMVLNLSTAAGGGQTLWMQPSAGVPTVRMWPWPPYPLAASTWNSGTTGNSSAGSSQTTASFKLAPYIIDDQVSFHDVEAELSINTVAGTGSAIAAYMYGLYTFDIPNSRFNSLSTFMFGYRLSQNSVTAQTHQFYWGTNPAANSTGVTNSSVSFTGVKRFDIYDGAATLTAGQYYIVAGFTQSSNAANVINISSAMMYSASQTTGDYFGGATDNTTPPIPFLGVFSTTSNANAAHICILPATIHTSVLTNTAGTTQHGVPHIWMYATNS